MQLLLETRQLRFQYPGSTLMEFPEITIDRGSHTAILGSSGSGKSTLLQLIAGLRTPQLGNIMIDGEDITKLSSAVIDHIRGKKIGIIYQTSHFVKALNVIENIRLAQQLAGQKANDTFIEDLLNRLGVGSKLRSKAQHCSIGEQQRIAIARALAVRPKLLLADEPTSALDDQNAEEVLNLLKEQADFTDATLLVVTHDNRIKNAFQNNITL